MSQRHRLCDCRELPARRVHGQHAGGRGALCGAFRARRCDCPAKLSRPPAQRILTTARVSGTGLWRSRSLCPHNEIVMPRGFFPRRWQGIVRWNQGNGARARRVVAVGQVFWRYCLCRNGGLRLVCGESRQARVSVRKPFGRENTGHHGAEYVGPHAGDDRLQTRHAVSSRRFLRHNLSQKKKEPGQLGAPFFDLALWVEIRRRSGLPTGGRGVGSSYCGVLCLPWGAASPRSIAAARPAMSNGFGSTSKPSRAASWV